MGKEIITVKEIKEFRESVRANHSEMLKSLEQEQKVINALLDYIEKLNDAFITAEKMVAQCEGLKDDEEVEILIEDGKLC